MLKLKVTKGCMEGREVYFKLMDYRLIEKPGIKFLPDLKSLYCSTQHLSFASSVQPKLIGNRVHQGADSKGKSRLAVTTLSLGLQK